MLTFSFLGNIFDSYGASKMKVKDLIEFLLSQPKDIEVAYQKFSEQCLLEIKDIEVVELCEPRPDGWIHDPRPDKGTKKYLLFPGN